MFNSQFSSGQQAEVSFHSDENWELNIGKFPDLLITTEQETGLPGDEPPHPTVERSD